MSFGEKLEKFWKIKKLVPGVSNFGRFGPWWDIFERKINFGLMVTYFGKYGPWVKCLWKLHVWSLDFSKMTILVPGNFKMEKCKILIIGIINIA